MLGSCVPATVPVRHLFSFPLTTLAVFALLSLLLPSAAHARALQREELEGSPILSLLLQRASLPVEDEDPLAPVELLPEDNTGVGLVLLNSRLRQYPIAAQRPSSGLSHSSFPVSRNQLRSLYGNDVVESPHKRQNGGAKNNLGIVLMCQLDSRNCAGKRYVGKKFAGSSWPRTLEAKLRRNNYLLDGELDQNPNDNRFLQI